VGFAVVFTWLGLLSAPPISSPALPAEIHLIESFFQQEETLEQSIGKVLSETGRSAQIQAELKRLERRKRILELRFKWLLICPGSFCINLGLSVTNLGQSFPPLSLGLAPAIGTFGMILLFDVADKYWNRFFTAEVNGVVADYDRRANEVLFRAEVEAIQAREVNGHQIDAATKTLQHLESLAAELQKIRDSVLKDHHDARKTSLWKTIMQGPRRSDDVRAQIMRLSLEHAHLQKEIALKQQMLKMIASIRAKLIYGDNRFSGHGRATCLQVIRSLQASAAAPQSSPSGPG
jgi:hypothetical protein